MARELTLVDCGLGQTANVRRALQQIGANPRVTSDPDLVARARMLVLPAYGRLDEASDAVCKSPLADAIRVAVQRGDPLLAIGLGMHLLFEGEEDGHLGLGILPGKSVALTRERSDAERERARGATNPRKSPAKAKDGDGEGESAEPERKGSPNNKAAAPSPAGTSPGTGGASSSSPQTKPTATETPQAQSTPNVPVSTKAEPHTSSRTEPRPAANPPGAGSGLASPRATPSLSGPASTTQPNRPTAKPGDQGPHPMGRVETDVPQRMAVARPGMPGPNQTNPLSTPTQPTQNPPPQQRPGLPGQPQSGALPANPGFAGSPQAGNPQMVAPGAPNYPGQPRPGQPRPVNVEAQGQGPGYPQRPGAAPPTATHHPQAASHRPSPPSSPSSPSSPGPHGLPGQGPPSQVGARPGQGTQNHGPVGPMHPNPAMHGRGPVAPGTPGTPGPNVRANVNPTHPSGPTPGPGVPNNPHLQMPHPQGGGSQPPLTYSGVPPQVPPTNPMQPGQSRPSAPSSVLPPGQVAHHPGLAGTTPPHAASEAHAPNSPSAAPGPGGPSEPPRAPGPAMPQKPGHPKADRPPTPMTSETTAAGRVVGQSTAPSVVEPALKVNTPPPTISRDRVGPRVPHRGWNDVQPSGEHYYFCHHAYIRVANPRDILWTSEYEGLVFPATIRHQNLFGCQFHPEQSQLIGLRFLRAFVLGSRS